MIEAAKAKGTLDDWMYSLAHSSSLAGNEALHEAPKLDLQLVPSAMAAAGGVVGYLFP